MTPRLYPALQADSLPLSHRGSPTRDCYSAIKRNEGLIHATSFCPHHPFWLSLFWSYGHLSSKSLALRFLCSKYLERLLLRSCSSAELSLCVFIVHTTQLQREEDGEWLLWQCLNQRRTLGKWNLFSASRSVRKYMSVVKATQLWVFCYGSLSRVKYWVAFCPLSQWPTD